MITITIHYIDIDRSSLFSLSQGHQISWGRGMQPSTTNQFRQMLSYATNPYENRTFNQTKYLTGAAVQKRVHITTKVEKSSSPKVTILLASQILPDEVTGL